MRFKLHAACAAVAAAALASPAVAIPTFSLLGTLPDGFYSGGLAINNAGAVAGAASPDVSSSGPDNLSFAIRYTGTPGAGGVMQNLGRLGGNESVGRGINSSGAIAGSSTILPGTTDSRAFRYVGTPGAGGVMQNLGTLGGVTSDAYGINDLGDVSGSSLTTLQLGVGRSRAFRYTGTPGVDGVMQDLGVVSGGLDSYGFGINASGQVAGYTSMPVPGPFMSDQRVFRSNPRGFTPALEDLGKIGGTVAFGLDINNAGEVVGYGDTANNGPVRAFRSGPNGNGQLYQLGTLGGDESRATAINNKGDVVGMSARPGTNADYPFLYLGTPGSGGEMIDLNAYVSRLNPSAAALWLIRSVTDINDNGQITGTGLYLGAGPNQDQDVAFVLNLGSTTFLPGDANRDRRVNFDDLLALAANYNRPTGATWSEGDFTLDGAVNFNDLLQLAANYNQTQSGTLEGDWALARASVPEPGSLCGLVASATTLRRRRR